MKKKYKVLTVLFGILVAGVLGLTILFYMAGNAAERKVGNFIPASTQLADGKYHGEFSYLGGHISADVSFEIRNGKLWLIRFDKLYGTPIFGAAQKVYFAIDDSKNLNFDAVTGATITSNLAKAAIKDAIEKGPIK